jgi:IclR family pca regulon transcriptional regulator
MAQGGGTGEPGFIPWLERYFFALMATFPPWKARKGIREPAMDQPTPTSADAIPLNQPDFVTALARGLSVIRALGEEGSPATLAEIARRVGLARATARRSLITLQTLG